MSMRIGLIGAGNMARAMAQGWHHPVLVASRTHARAEALAEETGGVAVKGNAELAKRADLVVLCHKPAQLDEVAAEVAPFATSVASVLGGVGVEALQAAYPNAKVHVFMPNTPVALRAGVVCHTPKDDDDPAVLALFAELGDLIAVPATAMGAATGLMGCAPAYWALLVEAQVDAGVRCGLAPAVAEQMVLQTMLGTAELLRQPGADTLATRRAVTSPGGSTARGLDALERGGIRAAFSDAMDAVVAR